MDADGVTTVSHFKAPTLLLADDSVDERTVLAKFLRRAGYQIEECEDGKATIERLQNREVDLLLLDLQMPNVDGFAVLNYLHKHRRGLPVVLLSGMPLDLIQLRMHGLEALELPPLFLKPVDLDQLLATLELRLAGELPDPKAQVEPSR